MSKSVDQRIVEMKFENGKFKNDIKETIDSLEKLKKESDFKELQKSAKQFDLSPVKKEVESLKFSFKDIFKLTIFSEISNSIVGTFESAFNKIPQLFDKTLNIIKTKGWNRAANLENAQFQLDGQAQGLWLKVQGQLNDAVADTAYGLDAAAKAASQLAASGVKVSDAYTTMEEAAL